MIRRSPFPRILLRGAGIVLASIALGSCGEGRHRESPRQTVAEDESVMVLGFAQLGAESAWRTAETASVEAAAEEAGIRLMYFNAEQKQANQIKHIRSLIAFQVDVIAFAPIVTTGWDHVLIEARNAGIPVVLLDRGIETELEDAYVSQIGYDVVAQGRKAAAFLKERFPEPDGEVRILELRGTDNSTSTQFRHQGFVEGLEDRPDVRIVHSESGDFMASRGYEITERLLSNPEFEVDVLFSHNDSMTLGALQAMDDLGLRPGHDIVIISFDAEQKAVDELRAGRINCIVECNPLIGPVLVNTAAVLAEDGRVAKQIWVTDRVFSEFTPNLAELPPRGY